MMATMVARPGRPRSTQPRLLESGAWPSTYHHGDFPAGPVLEAKARTGPDGLGVHPGPRRGLDGGLGRAGGRPALPGRARGQRPGRRGHRARRRLARRHRRAGPRRRGPGGGRARRAPAARARPWPPRWRPRPATSSPSSTPTWPTRPRPSSPGCSARCSRTDHVALVKGFYTRPLHGDPTGGGRVTELVARPVLELLFPELSWVRQPLAGETAAHRWVFEKLGFADGYGVELGLLIDVAQQPGAGPPGPGRPGRAHPPQPAPARAAPPGGRRAAGRARRVPPSRCRGASMRAP